MKQFTEKAIREAFIKLLNERPLDKITIKDIVEECGVARNTFYYHFADIPALLENVINGEIQRVLSNTETEQAWEDAFISGAQFALENKRFIYHAYKSVRHEEVERYLNSVAGEIMCRFVTRVAEEIPVSREDKLLIAEFYKSALVGMITGWLDQGMKTDPVPIIKRLGVMLEGNIELSLRRVAEEGKAIGG